MSPRAAELTNTPADTLKYQNDLIRTGKYFSLGRMKQIAIGPVEGYTPPQGDPFIAKFGRLIDFRDKLLPIAHSPDRSMILVTAPLVDRDGRVTLPDVPSPSWKPGTPTEEDVHGITYTDEHGVKRTRAAEFDPDRLAPPMIPQRLRDRTNEKLEGSNFLVFSPVERIAFQPELDKQLAGTVWLIVCGVNPVDGTHASLLVDEQTGEMHFFGGLYDIVKPFGE